MGVQHNKFTSKQESMGVKSQVNGGNIDIELVNDENKIGGLESND